MQVFAPRVDFNDEDVRIGDAELIERKGRGHPDSIADELASRLSREYCRLTVERCDGQILHHQFDKTMIVGGATEVDFGGGRFVAPIRVVLSGRISTTYAGRDIGARQLCEDVVRTYFRERFPRVPADMVEVHDFLTTHAGPGTLRTSTGSIAAMFEPPSRGVVRGYDDLVANDTSYCVAYAPRSALEDFVLRIEHELTGPTRQALWPWLGTDIKVMAYRQRSSVDLTVCVPQVAAEVASLDEYTDNLAVVRSFVMAEAERALPDHEVRLGLNTKDDHATRNYYLTVSGASLSGDIGVVGRGNRVNGLITARRPMSLEGTNGKNPRYYSGFVYAQASRRMSDLILSRTGTENIVEIVGQNGAPLAQPWAVRVSGRGLGQPARDVVADVLSDIGRLTDEFLAGVVESH